MNEFIAKMGDTLETKVIKDFQGEDIVRVFGHWETRFFFKDINVDNQEVCLAQAKLHAVLNFKEAVYGVINDYIDNIHAVIMEIKNQKPTPYLIEKLNINRIENFIRSIREEIG